MATNNQNRYSRSAARMTVARLPLQEAFMPDVLSKRSGAILEITLNRPEHGNGATDAMAVEVTRLIEEAEDGTQAIVLRGAGNDFCIGRAMMGQQPQGPVEAQERKRAFDVIFKTYGL